MSNNGAERVLEMRFCPFGNSKECGAWCNWAIPVKAFDGATQYVKGYRCELLKILEAILSAILGEK